MTCQVWSYSLIGFAWKHKTLCNSWNTKHFTIACLLLLVNLPAWRGILRNSEQEIILHTIEQLTKYAVLGIQFWSLKNTVVIRICKNLSNFLFLSKRFKAITVCWCKQPTSNSFQTCLYCIYLFRQYDRSIIILLTNDLANIYSEISKVRLILWMVYTCNVKGLEEVETLGRNECTLHPWPRSPVMSDCIRPYQ